MKPIDILLVEDNPGDARLTREALAMSTIRHQLHHARDGEEAIAFLRREGPFAGAPQPDLILLDLNLPVVDGTTLLEEVRSSEELKETPVVIMTGETAEHSEEEFRSLDVQGYLVKPVDIDQFLELVEKLRGYWKADMIISRARV
jgi:CheY-like chemotaxis protein